MVCLRPQGGLVDTLRKVSCPVLLPLPSASGRFGQSRGGAQFLRVFPGKTTCPVPPPTRFLFDGSEDIGHWPQTDVSVPFVSRPDLNVPSRCRGSFSPLCEKGSPSPAGIQFSSPAGISPPPASRCPIRSTARTSSCPVPTCWGSCSPLCENGSPPPATGPFFVPPGLQRTATIPSRPNPVVSRPIKKGGPDRPLAPTQSRPAFSTLDLGLRTCPVPTCDRGLGHEYVGHLHVKTFVTQPPVFPPILFRCSVFRSTPGAQRVRTLQ
jgi:hypothetical protein